METEKQTDMLRPDRIMKLYGGQKTAFGTKRLYAVGVGKNGVDCLMRCKHIAENRYSADKSKLRFLAIGEDELLKAAGFCGSTLGADERLAIVPDDAIYKYLNAPESLPETALSWFDTGLKNYTPAKPVYGLQKRQCGRVALFHYFNDLLKIFGEAISAFSNSTAPLDVVVVGNMGDAFFGGMMIDLGYILTALFETAKYPVKVVTYMFAGDTAQLSKMDGRDLANSYANTIVTKGELDRFQCRKTKFSQKYTDSFSVNSEKPPYSACYIASAEKTYEATLENAALKIMSEYEIIYKRDDDADKIMSYNMLGKDGSHAFRYLACDAAVSEIPLGRIMSYLTIRLFISFSNSLRKNSIEPMEMGKIIARLTPNAEFLVEKAGEIPQFEYDERRNPLFSIKSLKNGGEASKRYVDEKVERFAELCKQGMETVRSDIIETVTSVCDEALNDYDKGPFYAAEVVRKCLAELRTAIAKVKEEESDIEETMAREIRMVKTSYKKVKNSPAFLAARAAGDYISWLEEYGEYRKTELTITMLREFYEEIYNTLDKYYKETLLVKSELFEEVSANRENILFGETEYEGFGVTEAFDVTDPTIRTKLDKMVDELPESTRMMTFKRSGLMNVSDDPMHFPRELVNITMSCFSTFFGSSFDEFCRFFEADNSEASALEDCLKSAEVKTPAADEPPLTRIICPKDAPAGEMAPIRAGHKGLSNLWNDSAAKCAVSVVRIKGNVRLDSFKDYDQWENMRYAYVNDSLKKHGIHIFS